MPLLKNAGRRLLKWFAQLLVALLCVYLLRNLLEPHPIWGGVLLALLDASIWAVLRMVRPGLVEFLIGKK